VSHCTSTWTGHYLCAIVTRFVLDYAPLCKRGKNQVLQTIAAVLIIMWLLGMVTSYTMSGFIHILLILAVVSILVGLVQGRRIV
jgi:hypothetical protein